MWEKVGEIGVDAGLCWVGDPCYIVSKDASYVFEKWEDFCNVLDTNGFFDGKRHSVEFNNGLGVCVSTGYGDGSYPVYVKRDGNRIAEVKVVFIQDQDDLDSEIGYTEALDGNEDEYNYEKGV